MVCTCGHSKHAFDEPTVCIETLDCKCPQYREATPENPVLPDFQKYLDSIHTIKGKIEWFLTNIKFLRNYSNQDFVNFYHDKVNKKTDPETIRRAKQLLVAANLQLYGPFNPDFVQEKSFKQTAYEEYCVNG